MRKTVYYAAAIILLFGMLAGCAQPIPINVVDGSEHDNVIDTSSNEALSKLVSITYPEKVTAGDFEAKKALREENQLDESFVDSIGSFSAQSTSGILKDNKENACYSPLSLYMALALLSTGAEGETKQEITAVLGEHDTDYLSEQMAKVFRLTYADNDISKLYMTNSLWANENYQIKQGFLDNAMDSFYAAANNLNFEDESAGETISQWISDNTEGLLKPEIETSTLDLLFIINTVYLMDEWSESFNEEQTKEDDFTLDDGSLVKAEFMSKTLDCKVLDGQGYTAATLPLKNTGSMMFVLPDEGAEVNTLLASPESLEEMLSTQTQQKSVKISLPKFSFDSKFDLIENLKEMGMVKVFNESEANLNGIIYTGSVRGNAFVSRLQQETNITVNENGLEAAAYTLIEIQLRGAIPSEEVLELNYNRPFIFIVRSNENIPLFIGVVQNPAK